MALVSDSCIVKVHSHPSHSLFVALLCAKEASQPETKNSQAEQQLLLHSGHASKYTDAPQSYSYHTAKPRCPAHHPLSPSDKVVLPLLLTNVYVCMYKYMHVYFFFIYL